MVIISAFIQWCVYLAIIFSSMSLDVVDKGQPKAVLQSDCIPITS